MAATSYRSSASRDARFPGESVWRWHLQIKVERIVSPLRAALVLVSTAAWRLGPPGRPSPHGLAGLVAALAWCYVAADLFLVYRRPGQTRRWTYGSALLDLAFIVAAVAVTGRQSSPLLPLIFLGAFSAPIRLPLAGGLATTAAYTLAYLVLGGGAAWLTAAYVGMGGALQCAWLNVTHSDRRNSLRDALTGCLGRDYGLFQLAYRLDHGPWPFSIGIVDLDGFKAVNDGHGHPAGDVVLSQCCRLVQGLMRPDDLLARYGGDEFLIVWPGAPAAAARAAAERIRRDVEQAEFHLRAERAVVRLTVSIGLAEAGPGVSRSALLRVADAALYRAKAARNRVV